MKTTSAPASTAPTVKSLEQFTHELNTEHRLMGQWQDEGMLKSMMGGAKPVGEATVWPWKTTEAKLIEACDVLPESMGARRSLLMLNPGITGKRGTTNNLLMGIQLVKPGEVAWAHRHSIAALRFAIEGSQDLYSVVDGERLALEPNDLVLTPSWTWHDHHNESDKRGLWIDVLDVPFLVGLGQVGFEPYGHPEQVRQPDSQYISRRAGIVRPAWEQRPLRNYPLRYPWSEVGQELERLQEAQGSPFDDIILEYVNPMTGGSALPTMRCCVQSLRPGFEGRAHRRSSSTVYFVIEGEGTTVVDGKELRWGPRDVVAVPNACTRQHVNRSAGERAVLFSVSDAPLLEAVGQYREDPPLPLAPLPAVPGRPQRS
jgi:gentisate 1,2-dioxygenase